MLNKGGNVSFENGKINDQLMPAYQGMVHYFYGQNYLTINNSEIYTCPDEFYKELDTAPSTTPIPLSHCSNNTHGLTNNSCCFDRINLVMGRSGYAKYPCKSMRFCA